MLRPLHEQDAEALHRLVNDWEVTRTLAEIPYPYPRALADEWIASTVAQQAAAVEEVSRVVLGLHQQALDSQQGVAEMQTAIGKVDATSEAIVTVVESFRV